MTGNSAMVMRSQSGADGRSAVSGLYAPPVPRLDGRRTDSRRRPRGATGLDARPSARSTRIYVASSGLELRPLGSARHARLEGQCGLEAFMHCGMAPLRPRARRPLRKVRFRRCFAAEFCSGLPDSLPLRFAPFQASGKARLRVWAGAPSTAFPGACSESGMRPGTQRTSCREAAPNSSRRGLRKGVRWSSPHRRRRALPSRRAHALPFGASAYTGRASRLILSRAPRRSSRSGSRRRGG